MVDSAKKWGGRPRWRRTIGLGLSVPLLLGVGLLAKAKTCTPTGYHCGTQTECRVFVELCRDNYCSETSAPCPFASNTYPCGACVFWWNWDPPDPAECSPPP